MLTHQPTSGAQQSPPHPESCWPLLNRRLNRSQLTLIRCELSAAATLGQLSNPGFPDTALEASAEPRRRVPTICMVWMWTQDVHACARMQTRISLRVTVARAPTNVTCYLPRAPTQPPLPNPFAPATGRPHSLLCAPAPAMSPSIGTSSRNALSRWSGLNAPLNPPSPTCTTPFSRWMRRRRAARRALSSSAAAACSSFHACTSWCCASHVQGMSRVQMPGGT